MTREPFGAAALLAALLLAAPACHKRDVHVSETIEEAPHLASAVQMGDKTLAGQLVSGFYQIEDDAWRWTAQKFALNLHPPTGAAQQGAVLELRLTIPEASIAKLGSITLTASVGGSALAPETYPKAGEYLYKREVPAAGLSADSVRVDFQLDKALPPGNVDKRELGIIVTSAALVAK